MYRRLLFATIMTLGFALLAGCGQKGPLLLPSRPAAPQPASAASAPAATAPAAASAPASTSG